MKDLGVSKKAKDVIVESLCQFTDNHPDSLDEVVETLINNLDSAGYAIEMKPPKGSEVRATDIGHQALKMRRAEAAIKEWIIEQGRNGNVPRAHQAPGWLDYQREYDKFKLAMNLAEEVAPSRSS